MPNKRSVKKNRPVSRKNKSMKNKNRPVRSKNNKSSKNNNKPNENNKPNPMKNKKSRKGKRPLNQFFKLMLEAKKAGKDSFEYNRKTYVGKKHETLGMVYKKSKSN